MLLSYAAITVRQSFDTYSNHCALPRGALIAERGVVTRTFGRNCGLRLKRATTSIETGSASGKTVAWEVTTTRGRGQFRVRFREPMPADHEVARML